MSTSAGTENCFGCGRPLGGTSYIIGDHKYHTECYSPSRGQADQAEALQALQARVEALEEMHQGFTPKHYRSRFEAPTLSAEDLAAAKACLITAIEFEDKHDATMFEEIIRQYRECNDAALSLLGSEEEEQPVDGS